MQSDLIAARHQRGENAEKNQVNDKGTLMQPCVISNDKNKV